MKASILINNYNNTKFIKQCISSALNQTYKEIEVIVYDDGSTDNSLELIKQFDKDIVILSNNNYGLNSNGNQLNAIVQAFKKSTGDIIFLLDGDDIFYKNKVENVMKVFENANVAMAQHLMMEIDASSKSLDRIRPLLIKTESILEYIREKRSILNLFTTTSAQAYRKSFLEKIIFNIDVSNYEYLWADRVIPFHAVFSGEIVTLDSVLGGYRLHGSNFTTKLANNVEYDKFNKECIYYFEQISKTYNHTINLLDYPKMFLHSVFTENLFNTDLLKLINNQNIFIWGAGEAGRAIYQILLNQNKIVVGFIEGNSKKYGEIIDDIQVYSPHILELMEFKDSLVILSPFYSILTIKNLIEQEYKTFQGEIINPYKS